uniref:Uncharacterized protein n=1 Tax=Rhizophora mucronata TaxID=61149 RepID=A0A2P2J9V6_RHIMU
MITRRISNS